MPREDVRRTPVACTDDSRTGWPCRRTWRIPKGPGHGYWPEPDIDGAHRPLKQCLSISGPIGRYRIRELLAWLANPEDLGVEPGIRLNEAHNGYLEMYLQLGWCGAIILAIIVAKSYPRLARRIDPTYVGTRDAGLHRCCPKLQSLRGWIQSAI